MNDDGLSSETDIIDSLKYLDKPKPNDVRYSRIEWSNIISHISPNTALRYRDCFSDTFINNVLTAVAGVKTQDKDLIRKSLDIKEINDCTSDRRICNNIMAILDILPLVQSVLLCAWIDRIEIYNSAYYKNNIRDAAGSYRSTREKTNEFTRWMNPSNKTTQSNEYS